MTQRDLNRAVARATGEPVGRVAHMGFGLAVVPRPLLALFRRGRRASRSRPKHGRQGG